MDFLLECVGFPPDVEIDDLVALSFERGEPATWRGEADRHRRLDLAGGVELRFDHDSEARGWSVLPHYRSPHRLRVAVDELREIPDSRFDALLIGWAAPPVQRDEVLAGLVAGEREPFAPVDARGAYRLSTYLTDARRLPRFVPPRHVLAVSFAGFALDVSYVGPEEGARNKRWPDLEAAAAIRPLGSDDDPAGCAEISVRIDEVRQLENPVSGQRFDLVLARAPERPIVLFMSRWQLDVDDLPSPRPGWRVEGTFLFTGRIAGGLLGPKRTARGEFG